MSTRFFIYAPLLLFAFSCQNGTETELNPGTELYEVKAPARFGKQIVPEDNPTTVQGVELGRFLFYEKRLSANNTMSCGSCHQQKFAFSDGGKAVSVGIDGIAGTRSTMSLTNVGWEKTFNWDGSAKSLEEQAHIPTTNPIELHQNLGRAVNKLQNTSMYPPLFLKVFGSNIITEDKIVKALSQFQRTLVSANSRFDLFQAGIRNLEPDELAGWQLLRHSEPGATLRGGNCADCHGNSGLFTLQKTLNNGLDETLTDLGLGAVTGKETDNGKFKVPTLRNIALTAPYMHDGRFATLRDVLNHYNEHVKLNSPNIAVDMFGTNEFNPEPFTLGLTEKEKDQIIAFLHTLTDTAFINDKRFSDPFAK